MNKKTLLLLALIAVIGSGYFGYLKYTEKPAGASEKSAEVTVTAEELFQAFATDEVAAGKQFNDKVVQVSGTVREVALEPNGPSTVYLQTSDMLAAVACEFAPGALPAGLKAGDIAGIKGFCAGFNMDVLLQRCSIVE
jgi:hypothetical protein